MLPSIAAAIGVRELPGESLSRTLANHLHGKRTLLLLDNFEQVVIAAPVLQDLLDAAPELVILATSREPLRLRVEHEFPVAPLPLPREGMAVSPAQALTWPAVQLFIERAQAIKPGFTLDPGNVAAIVAICRRLDGLPLAIELAAARVRLLPPAALLARLDRRLTLLTGGARDLPARQQTLRAAIAWSYDLLEAAERTIFARFAVFAGGFTLEAADAVCNVAGGLPIDLLDGIDSLVQKSLLRQADGPGGDTRFTMLETIREFAVEQLQTLPEAAALRQAHADAYLALAKSADWDDFAGQAELLDRLSADHANLRQAIGFYEAQGEEKLTPWVQLAAALVHFWWLRGHFTEGRQVLDRAISARGVVPDRDCAAAISGAAILAEAQGDIARAEALQEQALAMQRASGDMDGVARALTGLGEIARQRGDLATARTRHLEALEFWRRIEDKPGIAGALLDVGLIQQLEGDYAGAEPQLREGLALFRLVLDQTGEAHALNRLGLLAMSQGDLTTAIRTFGESLALWRELGNTQMIASDLHNLGEANHLSGSLEVAEGQYREALALFEELGDLRGRGFALTHLGLLALDRQDPGEANRLLIESLRLRWSAGLRGATADTLEALAEATWQLGDNELAATILRASARLREETGLARQPIYEPRFQQVAQAVGYRPTASAADDLDTLIETLTTAHSPINAATSAPRAVEALA